MATTEPTQQPEPQEVLATDEQRGIVVDMPEPSTGPEPEPDKTQLTIDRMGNELGELRKQNKELLEALKQVQESTKPAPEPLPSYDENPQAFISAAVAQALDERLGPRLQVLESDMAQRHGEAFDRQVSEKYPDWKETAQDPRFAEWVQANPGRVEMYRIADQHFDASTAIDLIRRFRDDLAQTEDRTQGAIRAAGMVTAGGGDSGAKVYAASEVQRMINEDPEAYRRWLSADGMNAYREGRVDQSR